MNDFRLKVGAELRIIKGNLKKSNKTLKINIGK